MSLSPIDPMLPRVFQVKKFIAESADVFTMDLQSEGGGLFSFEPGQFNMLYAFGHGEVPISISGDPARTRTCKHTIRAVGPVTRALGRLKAGHRLGLRGPFGKPWPMAEARGKNVILVAGGIGLAPLRPALYHILNHRPEYGRLQVLFGARRPEDVIFKNELARLATRRDVRIELTVDQALTKWKGHVGVVPKLLSGLAIDSADTQVMICGPEVMIRHVIDGVTARGVPESQIHVSLERNMKCAVGFCGHCQYGSEFVCKDGPVFPFSRVKEKFYLKEL